MIACSASGDGGIGRSEDDLTGPEGSGMFGPQGEPLSQGNETPTAEECSKMDIVFVVDDSPSMEQEQANLVRNFPAFVDVIANYRTQNGDALDYRLAVTTSDDMGDRGFLVRGRGAGAPRSCSPGADRAWLERDDGDVASAFACRAEVGTNGGDIERPLESMLLAVTQREQDGSNASGSGRRLLREDALLAFVVITDEDEGGVENYPARSMGDYVKSFDRVKGDRSRWASAVIAGERACTSEGFGKAAEATRLKSFVEEAGPNAVFSSICSGDLAAGLAAALRTFDKACRNFAPTIR